MDVELEKLREALQALKTSSACDFDNKPADNKQFKQPDDSPTDNNPSKQPDNSTITPSKPPTKASILTHPLEIASSSLTPFWRISPRHRLQISDYKGKALISIREWYEKDGEVLPGMKASLLLFFFDAEGVVTVVW
ncbi:unnamed protein product [Zymoseptoria tritici ST99CH_3D1]|nr:unnamed protein product [Zymoseptoria tritici ST99CH_3D1]